MAVRVLLAEDDLETTEQIVSHLTDHHYLVTHAADGIVAQNLARVGDFDVLVIDRMLPGLDGLSLINGLQSERVVAPVLVLSALSDVDERVRGLKAGGDDYLPKPFALAELTARIDALLRRPVKTRETVLRAGPLELDLIERRARRVDRMIDLLPSEFKVLEYFMRRQSQIVTRSMLLEDVWHYRFLPKTNLVDVHIGKVRRKVDADGELPLLHNVRGAGYVLLVPE